MRYVDANVFVHWLGVDPAHGDQAIEIISRIERGEKPAASSLSLRLTGVVSDSLIESYSEQEFIERIKALGFLRIEPLLFSNYVKTMGFMKTHNLDLEDALHVAKAAGPGTKRIYSHDADFDRTA